MSNPYEPPDAQVASPQVVPHLVEISAADILWGGWAVFRSSPWVLGVSNILQAVGSMVAFFFCIVPIFVVGPWLHWGNHVLYLRAARDEPHPLRLLGSGFGSVDAFVAMLVVGLVSLAVVGPPILVMAVLGELAPAGTSRVLVDSLTRAGTYGCTALLGGPITVMTFLLADRPALSGQRAVAFAWEVTRRHGVQMALAGAVIALPSLVLNVLYVAWTADAQVMLETLDPATFDLDAFVEAMTTLLLPLVVMVPMGFAYAAAWMACFAWMAHQVMPRATA